MTGCVVILEGLIGAGKSTMAASIEAYCTARGRRVAVFREEIAPEFLQLMTESKAHLFAFQIAMLAQKIATLEHALSLAYNGVLVVVDRGPMGDYGFARMHYDAGHISDREWLVYRSVLSQARADTVDCNLLPSTAQMRQETATIPIKTALLTLDPGLALERMLQRNNATEVAAYDLAYFARLHAVYSELFANSAFADNNVVAFNVSAHCNVADGRFTDEVVEHFFAALGLRK